MSGLHIQSFRATLRVTDSGTARRAAAAHRELLDAELEAALAPYAPEQEIILVKRLAASKTWTGRHTDRQAAREWSDAIAHELDRVLRGGPSANLQRFRHRGAARLAFAHDALEARSQRDWAWHRLGLLPRASCTEGERLDALMRLATNEAEALLPLLRGLQESPSWPRFVARLDIDALAELAHAVLQACASSTRFADALAAGEATGSGDTPALASTASGAAVAPADAVALLRAVPATDARRRLWITRLALLLSDPRQARRGAAAIDRLVAPLLAADLETAPSPKDTNHGPAPDRRSDATAASHEDTGPESEGPRGDVSAAQPTVGAEADRRAASADGPDDAAVAVAVAVDVDSAIEPIVGHSEHAGLLLLLPLLEPCGVLALLDDERVWPASSWPLALHRFATSLVPLAADDAAALAFCGRRPTDAVPRPFARLSTAQSEALARASDLLHAALVLRLPAWRGAGLIERVALRRGRIQADPAWFEVRYALRDVSIDLRRAALDLDPGFIPWLGIVLRYVYE